jgi:hypothetical protein
MAKNGLSPSQIKTILNEARQPSAGTPPLT